MVCRKVLLLYLRVVSHAAVVSSPNAPWGGTLRDETKTASWEAYLKGVGTQVLIPSQSRHFYPPLGSVPNACLFPKAIQVYFTCTLVLVQVYPCTSSFTVTFLRASSTDVTG